MADFSSDDINSFLSVYSDFKISTEQGAICLSGKALIEADGKHYDFEVKICPSPDSPYKFPKVFELSNKIRKIADWHINSDGSFCFTVEPIELIACKNGIPLQDFYTKWLIPYLSNQQYRINEGKYANGEYSHNLLGTYEYYSQLLKTDNIFQLEKYMTIALETKKIGRTSYCYCGSGNKYRNCHKKATQELWAAGDEVLKKHLTLFRSIMLKLLSKN